MKLAVYLDSEKLKARITERLKALNKTPRGASIEAGLGASTIRNILEGRSVSPRTDTLIALAKVLEVDDPLWFIQDAVVEEKTGGQLTEFKTETHSKRFVSSEENGFDKMIPLYVVHEVESIWAFNAPKVFTERPPQLSKTKGAYAIFVRGSVMSPAYKETDIIYIDPNMPEKVNEDFLFYSARIASVGKACWFGRLESQSEAEIVIRQFGGVLDRDRWHLSRDEIGEVHAVVGKAFREA